MSWRKMFMPLVLVSLVAVLLVGCRKEEEKIQVTIGMWPEPYLQEDLAMFDEWKRMFEEDHPQYEIVGAPYSYSLDTFFPMAQSEQTPTVFETWFTEPQKLISNGFVRDITPQLEELGWLEKMDGVMRGLLSLQGKVYGVPRDAYSLGLLLNLEILEDVGLIDDWDQDGILDIHDPDGTPRYPQTFAQLALLAEHISDVMAEDFERDVAGFLVLSANNTGGWQFANMAWNFGANLQGQDENGKWLSQLNSPEAVKALEWIKIMRWELEALPASTSLTYADWYNYIGTGRAAMCFAGSDAISLPITNFNLDRNKLAFVPMPAGPGEERYSLFGGTPFMFAAHATDAEVLGALKFLEYMGYCPEVSEIAEGSRRVGMNVAAAKGMPILPTLHPWVNDDYLASVQALEEAYVNVHLPNFADFYRDVAKMRRLEEPHFAQEMYEVLDGVIQQVLANPTAEPRTLLNSANNAFQTQYLDKLNENQ